MYLIVGKPDWAQTAYYYTERGTWAHERKNAMKYQTSKDAQNEIDSLSIYCKFKIWTTPANGVFVPVNPYADYDRAMKGI